MMLSEHEISFIRLVLRSDDVGDGWRNVSNILWRLVRDFKPKELIEIDEPNSRVRLSERGQIVAEYLT
jgi:hypothetical protein